MFRRIFGTHNVFPYFFVLFIGDLFEDCLESWGENRQTSDIGIYLFVKERWTWFSCVRGMNGSSEIEIPLSVVNDLIVDLNLSRYHETIDQFILFEKTSTNVDVEAFSDILDKEFDSLLKNIFFLCNFKSSFKDFHKIVQRILIHRIDDAQIADYEIDDTASFCD